MQPRQYDRMEQYEIHCAKRYLDYTENEHFRAFRDEANPLCWMANYAVLKSTLTIGDTLYRVERFFAGAHGESAVPKFLSRPDSVSLAQARAAFERYGYAVKALCGVRMVQKTPPRTGFAVLPLRVQMRTVLNEPQERALVAAGAEGQAYALRMTDKQLAAGAKAFFVYNRGGIPVSWCLGEGYGSAFYLSDVFTPVACRKQGCATAVVYAAVRYAKEAGYVTVFLDADAGETGAQARRIYEALGFSGVAHAGYWAFKGELPESLQE